MIEKSGTSLGMAEFIRAIWGTSHIPLGRLRSSEAAVVAAIALASPDPNFHVIQQFQLIGVLARHNTLGCYLVPGPRSRKQ
jgi:hypothetical protein